MQTAPVLSTGEASGECQWQHRQDRYAVHGTRPWRRVGRVKTTGSGNPALNVKLGFTEKARKRPKALCTVVNTGNPDLAEEEGEGLTQLTARRWKAAEHAGSAPEQLRARTAEEGVRESECECVWTVAFFCIQSQLVFSVLQEEENDKKVSNKQQNYFWKQLRPSISSVFTVQYGNDATAKICLRQLSLRTRTQVAVCCQNQWNQLTKHKLRMAPGNSVRMRHKRLKNTSGAEKLTQACKGTDKN